jgi:hypothetical protein
VADEATNVILGPSLIPAKRSHLVRGAGPSILSISYLLSFPPSLLVLLYYSPSSDPRHYGLHKLTVGCWQYLDRPAHLPIH